jgi:hypothetical protein
MAKVSRIEVDFNKIYESSYDGPYKILEEIKSNDKKHRKVLVQFLNTGNTQISQLDKAVRGSVKDQNKRKPDFSKIYQSNMSGPFKFLEILEERKAGKIMAKIQFLETGTVREVHVNAALEGEAVDPFRVSVCGFGITGENDTKTREYATWNSMINRCYNPNYGSYINYGAKGVTVCDRWRYFDNFLNDIKLLPGYDLWLQYPGEYALDKDRFQMYVPENMKVYSPETCCFVSIVNNAKYAGAYVNNHKNVTSKFIGVYKKPSGNFEANICVNGNAYKLGTYESELAAAAMYNYVSSYYYPDIDPSLLNDIPKMSLDEIIAQRTRVKEMCAIIHKENNI